MPNFKLKVAGVQKLDAKLTELGGPAAARIGKAGVAAGAKAFAVAMKAAAPGVDARKAIGWRVIKVPKGAQQFSAKAGGGVGKKRKNFKTKTRNKPGVGISERNIHWLLLGTGPRWTGARTYRVKGGGIRRRETRNKPAFRGRMPADPFIKPAAIGAEGAAVTAMTNAMTKQLSEEIHKLK